MTLAAWTTSAAYGVVGGVLAGLLAATLDTGPVDPSQRPTAADIVR